jgi:hypothetical protein
MPVKFVKIIWCCPHQTKINSSAARIRSQFNKCSYIEPQLREFTNERVKETIDSKPKIRSRTTTPMGTSLLNIILENRPSLTPSTPPESNQNPNIFGKIFYFGFQSISFLGENSTSFGIGIKYS